MLVENQGSISYNTDRENEFSKRLITSLGSSRGGRFEFNLNVEFSGPYCEIRPAKLTNHSARTN